MSIALAVLAATSIFGPMKLVGEAWPEADALFQRDARWLGGDSVYSIDMGHGRVLWLFGDSFVATSAARSRHEAVMVRNCVGIQSGYDVTSASVKFLGMRQGGSRLRSLEHPRMAGGFGPGTGRWWGSG